MKPVIFLTLDNTLIKTLSTKQYSIHLEDWEFIKPTVQALEHYLTNGFERVCIICNQPAIANNLIPEKLFVIKMNFIVDKLEKRIRRKLEDVRLISKLKIKKNFISYSYTIDEESYYYLPKPGLIFSLALDFEIDVKNSIFIGNSFVDESSAIIAGVKTYINKDNLNLRV